MAKRKVFSIGSSLSDGLEQTFAAAQNYSNQLRIDVIPLSKIEVDPDNPRTLTISMNDLLHGISDNDPLLEIKTTEKEELRSLANSINEHGILNPVIVYESNASYRLIAGERRTLASILIGKTDIQAKIIDKKPDDLKIRLLQWVENSERTDLSLNDRLLNFEMIVNAYAKASNFNINDIRPVDISNLIGCSKPHASNLKLLLAADQDIRKIIAENKISNIEKIAILCQIKDLNLRSKAIQDAINGATLVDLKKYLEINFEINHQHEHVMVSSYVRGKKISLGSINNINAAKKIFCILLDHVEDSMLKTNLSKVNMDNPRDISRALKTIISSLEQVND
ncbi:ParB/RepB/Spo0J family partition protein (plasmid) [Legionella longbeachae]|uniref:ParB/RepB/Spo0J family partition protein n=1 Tax=Legionella longbeachae TaxID=450 RepID=UPI000A1C04F6|nr:ParB/RepB/Spo0J family partition protein [Legionella longbeachae]ARM35531.1 ParB/RepB/Spo0J family partition protein [Legionella longbeachae]